MQCSLLYYLGCSSGLAELLVKEAISSIFLNPLIWVSTSYELQRELYMFLIQEFDNNPRLLSSLCRLPRVLDIIQLFYCDHIKSSLAITEQFVGEKPSKEEIRKIRLLLLSLGEMSLRYGLFERPIFRAVCLLSSTFHCMY